MATLTTSGDITANGRVTSRANGSYGTIKRVPNTTTGESAFGFYRNGDSSVSATGDFWAVGHNAYGPGDRNFRIGRHNTNLCLSITSSGTVNIPYALQIGGTSTDTLYMARPWVQCVVNWFATILSGSDVGRVTPTISRTSGQASWAYGLSFPVHQRSFNYTTSVQARVDAGLAFAVVSNQLSNSLRVRTYNASQALTTYSLLL